MRLEESFRVRDSTELSNSDKPKSRVTLRTSSSPSGIIGLRFEYFFDRLWNANKLFSNGLGVYVEVYP